jgi:hypothetical protein
MQFISGNDNIWVARINPEDPIYNYNNEVEAQSKAEELLLEDTTGREYRVSQIATE